MPDLTSFLNARITEDETVAKSAADDEHLLRSLRPIADLMALPGGEILHLVRWDPARVLAECAAKRRIIAIHTGALRALSMVEKTDNGSPDAALAIGLLKATAATSEAAIKSLANVYADHPDFNPSWRVE